MIQDPTYLANRQAVIDAYGYWPDFHDSPVLRFVEGEETIEMELEAWEMTPETDERGYIKLIKNHVIGFRFSGIVSKNLDSFARDSCLFVLGFSSPGDCAAAGCFTVELDSAMGSELCGSFCAREGEVLFVRALGG